MTAQNSRSLVVKQQNKTLNGLPQNGLSSISVVTTLALAMSAAMMTDVRAEDITTIDTLVIEESAVAADANPYAQPTAPYKAKRLLLYLAEHFQHLWVSEIDFSSELFKNSSNFPSGTSASGSISARKKLSVKR